MVKKHYYSWQDVESACINIALQMYKDSWRPDYIVGITRGGAVPAVILSHLIDVPMRPLEVSLRDGEQCVSDFGMGEDAFGYVADDALKVTGSPLEKKILIVDDINDTGATFNWIKQDWQGSCLPNDPKWNNIWGSNVRFATITENLSSKFDGVQYYAHEVNKTEEDVWLVYPWENVGQL